MPLEAKEILDYLGAKAETLEEFKASFDKDFIKQSMITEDSEPVKKILGKTFGTIENEVKKIAKGFDLDVDFDSEDLKGKKVTDKLKFVVGEFDKKNKLIFEDLTAKAGLGNDEKVKEWQSKFEKVDGKLKEKNTLFDSLKGEFDNYKTSTANEIKNTKLNIHKKEVFGKANFIDDANEFTKKGFLIDFQDKYDIDLDENESPIIKNKKGERLISTKTAGTFKEISEVLEEELALAKLLKLNANGGQAKPAKQTPPPPPNTNGNNNSNRTRKVAERM